MNILEPMWDAKFLRRLIISDLFKNPSGFFEGNDLLPNPNSGILIAQLGLTKKKLSLKLVEVFLKTKFEGGRHLRRVKKI